MAVTSTNSIEFQVFKVEFPAKVVDSYSRLIKRVDLARPRFQRLLELNY